MKTFIKWLAKILHWETSRELDSFYLPKEYKPIKEVLPEALCPTTPPAPPTSPATPSLPPKPPIMPTTPDKLLWALPKQAWRSTRLLCDQLLPLTKSVVVNGVSYYPKDIVCATIFGESEFRLNAIHDNGASIDYSICQVNDGPPGVPPNEKWHIGPGKMFSSPQDVYNNPERQVRWMINYFKQHGHLNPWYAYKGTKKNPHPYKKHLLAGSRMWLLAK